MALARAHELQRAVILPERGLGAAREGELGPWAMALVRWVFGRDGRMR